MVLYYESIFIWEEGGTMMITAPAFLFAFLPFSVIFCVLFGKNRKKLCLSIVCAVYYVLFNMHAPINMLWLPLLIAFSYFAARAVSGKKKAIAVLVEVSELSR